MSRRSHTSPRTGCLATTGMTGAITIDRVTVTAATIDATGTAGGSTKGEMPPFLNLRESAVTYIAAHRMPRDYRDDRRDHDRSCDRHGGDDRRDWDRGGEYQRRDDRRDDRDRRNPRHRSRSRSPGRYGRDHPDSARDGRGAQDRRYDDQRHAQTTTEPAPTKRSEVRARGESNHAIPNDVSGFFNDLYARAPFPS